MISVSVELHEGHLLLVFIFKHFLKFFCAVPFGVFFGFSFSILFMGGVKHAFVFKFLRVFVNILMFKENKLYESKICITRFI